MRIELSIPDLSCDHCRRTVQGALGDLGFQEVAVDLPAKRVTFEAEEALLPAAMKALAAEGFPATRLWCPLGNKGQPSVIFNT